METKKCPYCGEEILAEAKKCRFCGEWLDKESPVEQVDCPTCAERIDARAAVCPFCHEPVDAALNAAAQSTSEPSARIPANRTAEPAQARSGAAVPPSPDSREADREETVSCGIFKTWFWNVVTRHYADFKGSMSRKEYWMFVLLNLSLVSLFSAGLMLCNGTLGALAYALLSLGTFLPALSAAVRRLHDVGKSGSMVLVALIPLVGPIWLLVLLCKKGESESPRARWRLADTIHVGAVGAVWALGILLSATGGGKYYVYEDQEWTPNCDFSLFYATASDNPKDLEPSDYIDRYGAQLIVAADEPFGEARKIISSEEIAARNGNVTKDLHYEIFPSTIDPDLVYFNYWMNGMEFPLCGKVDCTTGAFDLFNGTIIGMLSEGEYEGCYVKGSVESVSVYRQSPVGESAQPVATFDFRTDGGSNLVFLHDEEAADYLIEMLEAASDEDSDY